MKLTNPSHSFGWICFIGLIAASSASCRSSDKSTPAPQKTAIATATAGSPALSPGPTPKVRKFGGMILDKKIDASSCPDYKTLAQQNFHCKLAAVCDPCWVNSRQWDELQKPLPKKNEAYSIAITAEKLRLPSNVKAKAGALEEPWYINDSVTQMKDVLGLGGEFEVDSVTTRGLSLQFVNGVTQIQLTKPQGFIEFIEGKSKVIASVGPRTILRGGKEKRVFGYGSIQVQSAVTFCDLKLPPGSILFDLYEISWPTVGNDNNTRITKEIESYHRVRTPRPGKKVSENDSRTYREYEVEYWHDEPIICQTREIDDAV